MKSCGRIFQTEGGANRKGPGILKELEDGTKGNQFMWGTASQSNVHGFYSMER